MKKITIEWRSKDPDGFPFPVIGSFEMNDEQLAALVVSIEAEVEVDWR